MHWVYRRVGYAALLACLAVLPVGAQETVKFDGGAGGERVRLRAELYLPRSGGRAPAAIFLHGCSGLQPAVRFALRAYADDLQKLGFVALILDSFGSRYYSAEEMCTSNQRLRQAIDYRTTDLFDAARFLQGLPGVAGHRIFAVGQSNGGSVALNAVLARTQDEYVRRRGYPAVSGAVAFYPWCGLLSDNARLAAPVRVFSGGQDDWVSAQECAAVKASGTEYRVTVYANAPHSFDLEVARQKYAGFAIGNDRAAAADSRRRMVAFLTDQATRDDRR